MEHMTPEQFAEQFFDFEVLAKDMSPHQKKWLEVMQAYGNHCHDYALEQAAENATCEMEQDYINGVDCHVVNKQSILDLKINK